jgi:hypothetical protein
LAGIGLSESQASERKEKHQSNRGEAAGHHSSDLLGPASRETSTNMATGHGVFRLSVINPRLYAAGGDRGLATEGARCGYLVEQTVADLGRSLDEQDEPERHRTRSRVHASRRQGTEQHRSIRHRADATNDWIVSPPHVMVLYQDLKMPYAHLMVPVSATKMATTAK